MVYVLPKWNIWRDSSPVIDRLMDGKVLSTALLCGLCLALFGFEIESLLIPAAWLLSVSPSIGEEHGAVGRIGHTWGEYVDTRIFNREYGIKKALQRGVWMGACMTAATGFVPFIFTSLLFIPSIFIGQELNYRILKEDGWTLAEPLIGAAVFGFGFALMLEFGNAG